VIAGFFVLFGLSAQEVMTPELLWKLGRVGALGITKDGNSIVYSVRTYDAATNEGSSRQYLIPIDGGDAVEIEGGASMVEDKHVSPKGDYRISIQDVKMQKVYGVDYYPELNKSDVMIYDDLMYRHWDTWEDGKFSHIFLYKGNEVQGKDIMEGEPYNCPQSPFGGEEDYTWSPDGEKVVFTTKKKSGKDYTTSTNTDLYAYDIASGQTTNLTKGMMGYDTNPLFSSNGTLAWLSMKRDGYEADKNDIIVKAGDIQQNLTQQWDGTVNSFMWKEDGSGIYFNAAVDGTVQLFEVDYPGKIKKMPVVKQITKGEFDVRGLVGIAGDKMIV
ncbi:MAG: PD40 domain-containing protein, partial [Cyclobacteriaceae bacterium]|nr:PD40 domain-containing protein [Cyclobacteriaceae bacterium]